MRLKITYLRTNLSPTLTLKVQEGNRIGIGLCYFNERNILKGFITISQPGILSI